MFAEEDTVAVRVMDPTGVNGYSVVAVQCGVCPALAAKSTPDSTENPKMIIGGNVTRYSTASFKKHCGSATHQGWCEKQQELRTMPRALEEQAASGPIASFFSRGFASPFLQLATSSGAGGSSDALVGSSIMTSSVATAMEVSPASVGSTALQNTLACQGLVSGFEYYALAVSLSTKPTAKIGTKVPEDAVLEYVCLPDRVAETATVHHRECCEGSKCDGTRRQNSSLISAINQRAERARQTLAKIECLDTLLQGKLVPEPLKQLLTQQTGDKKDKEK